MEFTKLIAMQNNLGLGHKGDILLTTLERVDANQEPIAKDIINEEHAKELVRRWNAFEGLLAACDEGLHECERVKINCTCEHKDMGGLIRRIERIKAAIASAKA